MLLAKKRIFIIEDDSNNRFIMQSILEMYGATVAYENRAFQGITQRLLAFMPVDVILLDLMLPNTHGFQVYKQIHQDPSLNHIPVIAVSGSDPDSAMPEAFELGLRGFIAKPIDRHLFVEQIASVIKGGQIWLSGRV